MDSRSNVPRVGDPRLASLAGEYRAGRIDRRAFLERLIALAGSYPVAHHLIETTGWAATFLSQAETERMGVEALPVKYPGQGATLEGYLARPKGPGPYPTLIVIHGNRGLDAHIRDMARHYAQEGFVALAVDQLSRRGGTASFASPEEARKAIGLLTDDQVIADLDAAFAYLQFNATVRKDRIGVTGFCWGGQRTFLYATANSNLKAAAVYYGGTPPEEQLARINCPVLGNYGETDTRITSKVPETAELMKKYGKSYDPKIYPGAAHAFFNDTGANYNQAAAADAWQRTVVFFHEHMG